MDRDRHKVKRSSYTEEPVVSISVSSDGILLEADGVWLPGTVVQESRLLQDMVDSGVEGQVNVGISLDDLRRWMAFADGQDTSEFGAKDLLRVLQAADVLVDDVTSREASARLSRALFAAQPYPPPPPDLSLSPKRHDAHSDQRQLQIHTAMEALSPDLALLVLKSAQVPLPELLDALPFPFHTIALRAHLPSIDANRSVHLQHFRDPSATLLIARAVAELPQGHLTHLSLSNLSGPPVGWLAEVFAQVGKIHQLAALRLSGTYLHSTGANVLAPHLACLTGLRSLDLSSNSINVEGCRTLSPSLKHLHALCSIDVSYNRVSAGGIGALIEALATLPHLAVAKLGSNNIGPDGAIELAKHLSRLTGLCVLDLHSNGIGPSGAKALAPHIASLLCLRVLHLNSNNISTAGLVALAAPLACIPGLREISFGYNYTSPRGIQALTSKLLYHQASDASDLDAGDLGSAYSRQLLKLSLRCNEIGEVGAVALARCLPVLCALKTLDLHSTCLKAAGTAAIASTLTSLTSLESLLIGHNDMRVDGVTALAAALPHLPALVTLSMGRNDITAVGAAALATYFAESCRAKELCAAGQPQLQVVDLEANMFGPEGINILAYPVLSLPCLQSLDLGANAIGSEGVTAICSAVQHASHLQVLRLWHNDIGDNGARALAVSLRDVGKWGSLRKLHLSAHEIGPFESIRKADTATSPSYKVILSR